jgi:PTH1 family peptidyl-tRNA hydrolase
MNDMIQLLAFLGNPGPEYAGNRHNAGRLLIESLPFGSSLSWRKKFQGLYTALDRGLIDTAAAALAPLAETGEARALVDNALAGASPGVPVGTPIDERTELPTKYHFLMPETYMNRSGEPVCEAASFFKIKPEEILVIHDELEIPLGCLSLKFSGGLGGHNGLRSMKACFGTADFWRLRIGIGRPNHDDISGWVLSDFTPDECERLNPVLDAAAALLIKCLSGKPESLLPEWAKKKIGSL